MNENTKPYVGVKIIKATPMNRRDYNAYRQWPLPKDENGDDEGYLVEYTDGGAPNVVGHSGYVSWSPKEQFDNAYVLIKSGVNMTALLQDIKDFIEVVN